MNATNNMSARDAYNNARKMFYIAFRDKFPMGPDGDAKCQDFVNNFKLSQSEIRVEVELNATNNIFTFGITPNQANTNNVVFNTEYRLKLQNSLCVNEMFMYVRKPTSATTTTDQLRTYGNTQDFPTGAASLNSTLYSHGRFVMTVNNDVVVPNRGLSNFYYAPQTQQTTALGAGSPNDQFRGAEDAGITFEPNLVLIGSKDNVPQIELPTNLAAVDAGTRVVLIFKGIYAQNSTVVS
jgi:hypothetical protein